MSEKLEKLTKEALEVDCGRYYLSTLDIIEMAEHCQNNFINGSYLLFKIGFLKGQRAEKARRKNKRQSQTA